MILCLAQVKGGQDDLLLVGVRGVLVVAQGDDRLVEVGLALLVGLGVAIELHAPQIVPRKVKVPQRVRAELEDFQEKIVLALNQQIKILFFYLPARLVGLLSY